MSCITFGALALSSAIQQGCLAPLSLVDNFHDARSERWKAWRLLVTYCSTVCGAWPVI
jgi:hypothetical protein